HRNSHSFPTRRSSDLFTAADYDNSILAHASGSYLKGFGELTSVNNPVSSSSSSSSSSTASSVAKSLTSLRSGMLDSSISMDFLRSEEHTSELQSRENL